MMYGLYLLVDGVIEEAQHHGISIQLPSDRQCNDPGPVPGDQSQATGCSGGHPPQEYHSKGEFGHIGR